MVFNIAKSFMDASSLSIKLKILGWARINKINPFDMGPKNYLRCLYDLNAGGKYYELQYNEDGSLKYQ